MALDKQQQLEDIIRNSEIYGKERVPNLVLPAEGANGRVIACYWQHPRGSYAVPSAIRVYPDDPLRRGRLVQPGRKAPIASVAKALAKDTSRICAFATLKQLESRGSGGQAKCAGAIARFAFAVGVLPARYDTAMCFGADEWDEDMARTLDALGIDIAYDDTKKLAQSKKKLITPHPEFRITIYHEETWKPGAPRFSKRPKDIPLMNELHAYFSAEQCDYACWKAVSDAGLLLPKRHYAGEEVFTARLVEALTLGRFRPPVPTPPASCLADGNWNWKDKLRFLEVETTVSSAAHRWSKSPWWDQYKELCVLLELWRGAFVSETRSGKRKKTELNEKVSTILMGKESATGKAAEEAIAAVLAAGEGAGVASAVEALDAGVPVEDVVA